MERSLLKFNMQIRKEKHGSGIFELCFVAEILFELRLLTCSDNICDNIIGMPANVGLLCEESNKEYG